MLAGWPAGRLVSCACKVPCVCCVALVQVFLISKAGTHGINLVSCRHIAVLEENWNPVYSLQVRGAAARSGACHWQPLLMQALR